MKVLPHHDLALLKLPLTKAAHFELPGESMGRGTVLFMLGNLLGDTPGPAAGKLNSIWTRRGMALTLFTTVPTAAGDSGGPVINESGELAGVVSGGWFHRYFPLLSVSTVTSLGTAEIRALIAADRTGQ